MDSSNFVKNIISKDNNVFNEAVKELLNPVNIAYFEKLDENSDFIFPSVREKIIDSFVKLINKDNLEVVFNLMKYYSYDFEDMVVLPLLNNASEDITDSLLEILENGTDDMKSYACRYFSKIKDPLAIPLLNNCWNSEFYYLKINCAHALACFNDKKSLDAAKEVVKNSADEFEKLSAIEFIASYGCEIEFILDYAFKSPFKENIITTLLDFNDFEILKQKVPNKIPYIFNVLIDGYPESISLNTIKFYSVYKFIKYLLNSSSNYAKGLLLTCKNKIEEFLSNENYLFDLDKFTKDELKNIFNILKDLKIEDFKVEYSEKNPFEFENTLNIIKEYNIGFADLIDLINLNKLPLSYVISALEILKQKNLINKIDKNILENMDDDTLKAVASSFFG